MLIATTDVPEPFRSKLTNDDVIKICDVDARTPDALYGRALARIVAGRDNDARADLVAALPSLGDPCRVELAFLEIRQRGDIEEAIVVLRFILERVPPDTLLQARAFHIAGLAEGKVRRHGPALEDLLAARQVYARLDCKAGLAQVHDTLGMLDGALGRLDTASNYYMLSLVDKMMLGDRQGMAITLGNLGRLHLRVGRFEEAVICFERDLELAREVQDAGGQARMHEDLGRTYLAMGQLEEAGRELQECVRMAEQYGLNDLSFFAEKDIVLLCLAERRLPEAEVTLRRCEQSLPDSAEPYLRVLASAARADLLAAQEDPRAIEELTKVVHRFEELELPDLEIPSRISLAQALVSRGKPGDMAAAEQCLSHSLRLARSAGYARFVSAINEAMCRLDLHQSIVAERQRKVVRGPTHSQDCYIERRLLGQGSFGDVVLAYDPHCLKDVAVKRLRLEKEYDVHVREQLLSSARTEWEAANKIDHPGVVKVRAIGYEGPEGGMYVVQDYVPGRSLRDIMQLDSTRDMHGIVLCMEQVAQALHALHSHKVIHRDLKPENIIVRADDGLPVLVDFGLAHIQGAKAKHASRPYGTIAYMAPEQLPGAGRIGCRADLYALGVILYEWLTGRLPITPAGQTPQEQMASVRTTRPVPLTEYRPDVPSALERLVASLLSWEARGRPADAYRVAERLRTFLQ